MNACHYCGQSIYNDSDSHPVDPAGPWLEFETTERECTKSPDGVHHPHALPYPPALPDDDDLTYSIDCPTCGAIANELCLTESGWVPDKHAHPARSAAIIVECSWMADGDEEPLIFRAVSLDPPLPMGCCPVIDEATRDLFAEEIAEEFADVAPSEDGLFHLDGLGWTFGLVRNPEGAGV